MLDMHQREKALLNAAREGDVATAQNLLEGGVDIDFSDEEKDNPLFRAAYAGHAAVVALLLRRGAKRDIRNSVDCTPLMGAADKGHLEVVRLLLENGADPSIRSRVRGKTAMDWAKDRKFNHIVDLLSTPAEVIFYSNVSDRTLEEIFNFESRERISLLRKEMNGTVEAMTRQNFSDIEDSTRLLQAFEEHKRRGGKLTEADIFPRRLFKPVKGLKNL